MSIVWETLELSAQDLLINGDVVRFMVLLRSASLYQAKSEKVSYNRLLNLIFLKHRHRDELCCGCNKCSSPFLALHL